MGPYKNQEMIVLPTPLGHFTAATPTFWLWLWLSKQVLYIYRAENRPACVSVCVCATKTHFHLIFSVDDPKVFGPNMHFHIYKSLVSYVSELAFERTLVVLNE